MFSHGSLKVVLIEIKLSVLEVWILSFSLDCGFLLIDQSFGGRIVLVVMMRIVFSHILIELVLVAIVTFILLSNILHQGLSFFSLIVLGTFIELRLHSGNSGFKLSVFLHVRLNFFILPIVSDSDFRFAVNWSVFILTDSNPRRFSQFGILLPWRGFCSINSSCHFKLIWTDTSSKTFSFCHLIVLLGWALPVSFDTFCHSIQGSFLVLSIT